MSLNIFKLLLLASLFMQVSCDITFKRNTDSNVSVSKENTIQHKALTKEELKQEKQWRNDFSLIKSFYADAANSSIRKDMISHTKVSKKQSKKIVAGKAIPRDIQVMPLPMILERKLSTLPLHLIRVQVGAYVVLMKVKSRLIVDLVKI
ncbi:MAG TPA: hypothetical protein ENJ28_12065 [Gammaproteobacteria bacterium]|nr:hypothetical protein [Gammaproteobacteria bacterium]